MSQAENHIYQQQGFGHAVAPKAPYGLLIIDFVNGFADPLTFGGGNIDPNQELIAHGPANILSGFFGGFLVVGSLSKTSVAMAAGARINQFELVEPSLNDIFIESVTGTKELANQRVEVEAL